MPRRLVQMQEIQAEENVVIGMGITMHGDGTTKKKNLAGMDVYTPAEGDSFIEHVGDKKKDDKTKGKRLRA